MKFSLKVIIPFLILLIVTSTALIPKKWNDDTPIYDILKELGESMPAHAPTSRDEEKIKQGRDLIFDGRTIGPNGKKSKFISKFYVCTSCHNTSQEDPDLSVLDPEARLDYVAEKGMKFLQGSPLYGIANRETWYNDDYYLKYGDLVKPANKSLAEATQLCAKVCSSGRYLEDWELEAILAYFWDIQIKLGDLNLSKSEKEKILNASSGNSKEVIALLKSKYALKSPATFGDPPKDHDGYKLQGRPEKGKLLYELSCQSCHVDGGVAGMPFDNTKITFQKFKRNLEKHTEYNIYEISRHGTYAGEGKPRYMPLYPKEKMSDQQLEDLKAYILQEAS